ncbi:GNAT family N-acetyltransferase [Streptococcus orisratti]|uniref:GNAT family N-acetyltransferase n=1 Tax=Streptococcus orisratti TaxID=114652 RepID=UPI0023FA1AEB|nr:GNAT family N-acetyltransferase [Streptococcus orisratti]
MSSKACMEIRKIKSCDQEDFEKFNAAMLADKENNPFVEWWDVSDFDEFVRQSDQSEVKLSNQTWPPFTRYFAFSSGQIAGLVICFWELDHPDCQTLGHFGYMVAPSFRRQGLASRLFTFALEHYRQLGSNQVFVATDEDNVASRSLIEKMGGQLLALETIPYYDKVLKSARYSFDLNKRD